MQHQGGTSLLSIQLLLLSASCWRHQGFLSYLGQENKASDFYLDILNIKVIIGAAFWDLFLWLQCSVINLLQSFLPWHICTMLRLLWHLLSSEKQIPNKNPPQEKKQSYEFPLHGFSNAFIWDFYSSSLPWNIGKYPREWQWRCVRGLGWISGKGSAAILWPDQGTKTVSKALFGKLLASVAI